MAVATQSARPPNVGIPEIAAEAVRRPRVVEAILERLEESGIVHVIAPAGSGKTTAVAQAALHTQVPVAWLTLESWDQHPGRLLADLVEALSDVAPSARSVLETEAGGGVHLQASLIGSVLGSRQLVLVVDDAHLLREWPQAGEVLATVIRHRGQGLKVLLVGRAVPALPGLTAIDVASSAVVSERVLCADATEAAAILAAYGSAVDPTAAVEETGGWIAGLVFETLRRADHVDALGVYLSSSVRPLLSQAEDSFLVECSVFDRVDRARSIALAGDEGPAMLEALRIAGLPAVWEERTSALRLHPRVREVLSAELGRRPAGELRRVMSAAAAAYRSEGLLERALDAHIQAREPEQARELLPEVIGEVVGRLDIDLARYFLDEVPLDDEPASVVLARLALALLEQRSDEAGAVLERLEQNGELERVIHEVPEIGAIACNVFLAAGRIDDASALARAMPRGRAADAARLLLSAVRDDSDGAVPALAGDVLDPLIARGLFFRGRLDELRGRVGEAHLSMSGVPDLVEPDESIQPPLGAILWRFAHAIERRDLPAARRAVADLEGIGAKFYAQLASVELAVRIERNAAGALGTLERLRAHPAARVGFYRELADMWEGAALLLEGGADQQAASVLQRAVEGMRRGDRVLELPASLVYLAEAQWRLGHEDDADRSTADARLVARAHGNLRRFVLALADFPGVLSRSLDLEQEMDGEWHALARALVVGGSTERPMGTSVHLTEFGEPALAVAGEAVHPKIRKSVELLSFLMSRPAATAQRAEILDALWNGRDDDRTRSYLRQAIRHLRSALPSGVEVESKGNSLSVVGAVMSEVGELELLLREAGYAVGSARLALLFDALQVGGRGTFLDGSRDVKWVDDRRRTIESRLAAARLDAAELLIEESRLVEALTLADEALERDTLLERGWRVRMRALGMLGDADGVVDAYRSCGEALAGVGLVPSRSTVELARTLRRG